MKVTRKQIPILLLHCAGTGDELYVNAEAVCSMKQYATGLTEDGEKTDTLMTEICLVNGHRFLVKESPEEILLASYDHSLEIDA